MKRSNRLLESIADRRPLVFDGAMGTMLQEGSLAGGGAPELLNLSRPEEVAAIHRAYVEAGADILETNSFGGNRIKLAAYGLEGKVRELSAAAVRIARKAAADQALVSGSMGPTGRFLAPVGDLVFEEALEIFAEQGEALAEAGADLLTLETFSDIREIRAAAIAVRATGLPVIACMTFEQEGRTLLGTPPEAAAVTLEAVGVTAVGANCGAGPERIVSALRRMASATSLPLVYMPNAGMPHLSGDRTVFPGTPEEIAAPVEELLGMGTGFLGGCCGTTPGHIARLIREVAHHGRWIRRELPDPGATRLSCRGKVVFLGGRSPVAVIGERLNPTGRKALAEAVRAGDFSRYREEARAQAEAGAQILDVNVGLPGIDEQAAMREAVAAAQQGGEVPLVIDSPRPEVLEAGLAAADGKVLLNSVTGEPESLVKVLPLARRYGAAVLGLTLDAKGIPRTAEDRLAIARRILAAAKKAGLPPSDLVIDCLTLSAGAEQEMVAETLSTLDLVRRKLGLATSLGVSNVSFGLPARESINAAFLAMAASRGLSAAIVNPHSAPVMEILRASRVVLNQDVGSRDWIRLHSGSTGVSADKSAPTTGMGESAGGPGTAGVSASAPGAAADGSADTGALYQDLPPEKALAQAVIDGEEGRARELAEELLSRGMPPGELGERILIPAMSVVGSRFARSEYFLPQVVASARAMKAAFARVRERLSGSDLPSRGTILMATVEGDIHDIGKNMVITLLENYGYTVVDLGKNIPASDIASRAKETGCHAIGLSALMTTTMGKLKEAVAELRRAGVRVPVAVGGAAVTESFAAEIGADGYAPDATSAVDLFTRLLERGP